MKIAKNGWLVEPELLQHPNIPKPLHGLSPRAIKGTAWWNDIRSKVYAEREYHCFACGVHKHEAWPNRWLECHEDYEIDYKKCVMRINRMVALCPACHMFIHSGRLACLLEMGSVSENYAERILEHGFGILNENGLVCSYATYCLIQTNALPGGYRQEDLPIGNLANRRNKLAPDWSYLESRNGDRWSDWRLEFENIQYKPLFANKEEWARHYGRKLE